MARVFIAIGSNIDPAKNVRAAIRSILRRIENELRRKQTQDKYAPQMIDLDLIAYDELAMDEEDTHLPDPQILERPFLATPLFELAPCMVSLRDSQRAALTKDTTSHLFLFMDIQHL